jgi:hypothetical protein
MDAWFSFISAYCFHFPECFLTSPWRIAAQIDRDLSSSDYQRLLDRTKNIGHFKLMKTMQTKIFVRAISMLNRDLGALRPLTSKKIRDTLAQRKIDILATLECHKNLLQIPQIQSALKQLQHQPLQRTAPPLRRRHRS